MYTYLLLTCSVRFYSSYSDGNVLHVACAITSHLIIKGCYLKNYWATAFISGFQYSRSSIGWLSNIPFRDYIPSKREPKQMPFVGMDISYNVRHLPDHVRHEQATSRHVIVLAGKPRVVVCSGEYCLFYFTSLSRLRHLELASLRPYSAEGH